MLKIGVGPSSSHTLGPWRAVQRFLLRMTLESGSLEDITSVQVTLYGSLALTGVGHCTDKAICLAPAGYEPETVPVEEIDTLLAEMSNRGTILLAGRHSVPFDPSRDIVFRKDETLPGHANAVKISAAIEDRVVERVYYSVGVVLLSRRERRRSDLSARLLDSNGADDAANPDRTIAPPKRLPPGAWIRAIQDGSHAFSDVLKWVSCFALAVNEENANLGRVVTAPTNGAAGVIPAVLMYHICFSGREVGDDEIAMEHHLGMTCDPIGGLVQVPCIERNSMEEIKAINAAELALESDPDEAIVTLDEVINTMRETARDMNTKYKETSQGGLAVNISVRVPEC